MGIEAGQPGRIHIKDLVIPEPKMNDEDMLFLPERDIPNEVWQLLIREMNQLGKQGRLSPAMEMAARMKLLRPERVADLQLDAKTESVMRNNYDSYWGIYLELPNVSEYIHRAYQHAISTHILFPHLYSLPQMQPDEWEHVKTEFAGASDDEYIGLLESFVLLFPDVKKSQIPDINEFRDLMRKRLRQDAASIATMGEHITEAEEAKIAEFIRMASVSKLVFGKTFTKWQVLSQKVWTRMKRAVEGRSSYPQQYVPLALDLTLLSATSIIRGGENLLEFVIPKPPADSFDPEDYDLPHVRKF